MYKCTNCGQEVKGKLENKGSCCLEAVLWFFFIIPGLIYSIWRMCDRRKICEKCGSRFLVKIKKKE